MSVAEYLRRREILQNTTFIINTNGFFYRVDGKMVPAKEFEKSHELPISLVNIRGKAINDEPGWRASTLTGNNKNRIQ